MNDSISNLLKDQYKNTKIIDVSISEDDRMVTNKLEDLLKRYDEDIEISRSDALRLIKEIDEILKYLEPIIKSFQ
jgi:uncharacterized protein (UPF0332 family)